jgi:hypothetical protein
MNEKKIQCLNCGQNFSVFYNRTQSSISSCKKKYCSDLCKKESKNRIVTTKSVHLTCEYCGIDYFRPPSLAKNSRFCSRVCANRKYAENNIKVRHVEKCLSCKASLSSVELKKRRSLRRKYCSIECFSTSRRANRLEIVCVICKKTFFCLQTKLKKFCSRDCQYSAQSSGLIKLPSKGRAGYRADLPKDMRFKSSFEADYARYCNFMGLKFEYEPKTFDVTLKDGKRKRYTPDFYLVEQDLYIETKAIRKDKKFEANLESLAALKESGINIEPIYMVDFYAKLKSLGYYQTIENLEHRDYRGTKHLVL